MQKEFVMMYAIQHAMKDEVVSPTTFQSYLYNKDEVKKAFPIEDLQSILDLLVTAGFLEVIDTSVFPMYSKVENLTPKKLVKNRYNGSGYLGASNV